MCMCMNMKREPTWHVVNVMTINDVYTVRDTVFSYFFVGLEVKYFKVKGYILLGLLLIKRKSRSYLHITHAHSLLGY